MSIEPYASHHLDAVIQLSLRAWAPVFASLQDVLNTDVYQAFYPEGWRISQQNAVRAVCEDTDTPVWVAVSAGLVVGFIAVKLHAKDGLGEIYMVAVDPDFQGQGIGRALMEFALGWLKEAGMSVAMVETGGDSGHAPARRTYEKAGFDLLPVARYFKRI